MHQVSLKKICPLEAFQLYYCPDNDAKSMVKHFIFLQTFAVLTELIFRSYIYIALFFFHLLYLIIYFLFLKLGAGVIFFKA